MNYRNVPLNWAIIRLIRKTLNHGTPRYSSLFIVHSSNFFILSFISQIEFIRVFNLLPLSAWRHERMAAKSAPASSQLHIDHPLVIQTSWHSSPVLFTLCYREAINVFGHLCVLNQVARHSLSREPIHDDVKYANKVTPDDNWLIVYCQYF